MDINAMPEVKARQDTAEGRLVIGAALVLIIITGGSRVLGLVREATVAAIFGAGIQTDSFFVAFSIPDFLFNSLSNFLIATSFIPIFCKCMGKKGAWEFTASVLVVLVSALLAVVLFLEIFAVEIISIIMPSAPPGQLALIVEMTRIMTPIIIAGALTGLAKGVLNSYRIYAVPALTPVVYNVVIIGTIVLFGLRFGIKAMAIGVVAAAALQFLIQVPGLWRTGITFLPKIDFRNKDLKRFIANILPVIIALSIGQIVPYFEFFLASQISIGSISYLNYANRIFVIPEQVVVAAITTVIFPLISVDVAEQRLPLMSERLSRSMRMTFFAILPLSVFMAGFSMPIIQILLGRGEFNALAVQGTSAALATYSIGLISISIRAVLLAAFFALGDTRTLLIATATMVPLNIIADLELIKHFSYRGIALGTVVTATLHAALLIALLRRRIGPINWGPRGSMLKTIASTAVISALFYMLGSLVPPRPETPSLLRNLIYLGSLFGTAMAAYLGLNLMLKVEEAQWIRDFIREKLQRKPAGVAG